MTRLVMDASVALKWAFPDGTEEQEGAALTLLSQFIAGDLTLIQPPHWPLRTIPGPSNSPAGDGGA